MKLMDAAAGLVGMRHSLRNIATADTSHPGSRLSWWGDLIFCSAGHGYYADNSENHRETDSRLIFECSVSKIGYK